MGLFRPIVARARRPSPQDPILDQLFNIAKDRNLSLNDLGEDAGLGGSVVHAWGSGRYSPKLRSLRKVLDALDLDIVLVPRE